MWCIQLFILIKLLNIAKPRHHIGQYGHRFVSTIFVTLLSLVNILFKRFNSRNFPEMFLNNAVFTMTVMTVCHTLTMTVMTVCHTVKYIGIRLLYISIISIISSASLNCIPK